MILQIEFNSINSTVRNRLLLQFIHFRNMLLEVEAFLQVSEDYTRLPETSILLILLKEIHKILQNSSISTFQGIPQPEG